LFWRGVFVSGWSGGGKSRLRGVGAELESGLIGGLSKVREEVADLLLAGVDDLAGRSPVDGAGHVLTELLEAAAQLLEQSVRRHGGFGNHGLLQEGKTKPQHAQRAQLSFPLIVSAPERFATPGVFASTFSTASLPWPN
jgi:hypothetical protein